MNQVGDIKTFHVTSHTTGATYVWKFWDGSTAVSGTTTGSTAKQLNLGGNPAEAFTVPVRVDVCDASQGDVIYVSTGRVAVNNPPTIYGAPTVSKNDAAFPFWADFTVAAYDLEEAGVQAFWYAGTHPLPDEGISTSTTVEGTYYGTLTGLTRDLYVTTFTGTVYSSGTTFTCKIIDGDSGTTRIDFDMRGYDPASPAFAVNVVPNDLTAQAANLTTQVIAPGQSVFLSAYSYDIVPGQLQFIWELQGTNGWSAPDIPFYYVNDGTAVQQGYKSEWSRQLEEETSGGLKRVIVRVTNPSTGKTTLTTFDLNTVVDTAPTINSVGVYNATSGAETSAITKAALPTRTLVQFSGSGTDADGDVLSYTWSIAAPVSPTSYVLHGRNAFVDVTDWPLSTYTTIGNVVAVDKYGQQSLQFSIPTITVV